MVTSLLKTLAGKYDSSVSKMARKYGATTETPHGPCKCLHVSVARAEGRKPLVATFGGIPLRRQKFAILRDREPVPAISRRKELVHRLLAGRCELCGQADEVHVHQIRKLADLDKPRQPDPPDRLAGAMQHPAPQGPAFAHLSTNGTRPMDLVRFPTTKPESGHGSPATPRGFCS